MRARRVATFGLLAVACGASGPIGKPFNTQWENDGGKSISDVQKRVAGAKLPPGPGVAVGVTSTGLVGATLDGSAKWTHDGKVDARPVITGQVVVATTGSELFALDAKSGKKLWRTSSKLALRGAGDDGKVTVVSLGARAGGGSKFIAIDRGGSDVRSFEPDPEIGAPGVLGGVAFIPWGNQYVSAIELSSGDEIGRLLLRDKVSRAINLGGHLYLGELSVVRFDEKIAQAVNNQGTRLTLPKREFPGEPLWLGYGATVAPTQSSARDSVRYYAAPAADGASFDSNRFAATYFRVAIGLESKTGELEWVRTLPHSLIGGAGATGGFALCDTAGEVWLLDAKTGAMGGKVKLGSKVDSCVVQGGAFTVKANEAPAALGEQISKAIRLRMPQMVAAQQFLLGALVDVEDPAVTGLLIELLSDPQTVPALTDAASSLLAKRRNGESYMLGALGKHYDFLSDVERPPPVGPLAEALAAMEEKRAAPMLAEHLNDPANSPAAILKIAKALSSLATTAEVEHLRIFFALYRATADQEELVEAVVLVGEALARLGGTEGKDAVERAKTDPLTNPEVKEGLRGVKIKRKRTGGAESTPAE